MARPADVESGIFFRGVILVCEHNPNGSFGLVVNKALDLELPARLLSAVRGTLVKVLYKGARAEDPESQTDPALCSEWNSNLKETSQLFDQCKLDVRNAMSFDSYFD